MPAGSGTRIDVRALSIAGAVFWALIVLLVALGNLGLPPYGSAFLKVAASIYPGYQAGASLGQVVLVTFYAVIDGAIAGAVLGWLYNRVAD